MPVLLRAAIWNVQTEVGSAANDPRDLVNLTAHLKWQDRLKMLRTVVELANAAIPTPTGLAPGTQSLRVFLAPEYFFSETCSRHVVNYETRGHIVEGLAKLSADYPDLLLIPGTVAYFKPLVDKKLEAKRLAANPGHVSRVVRYQGLFTVGDEKSTYIAHNTAYAFYNGQKVFKYRKLLDCGELNAQDAKAAKIMVFASGDRVGSFNFTGAGTSVKIGMEICADHENGQLQKGGGANLDLHIVLAASTALKKDYTVVRDGGVVLYCNAGDKDTTGSRRAWQKNAGVLEDLRTAVLAPPPAAERIDPSTRPELSAFKKTATKLDTAYHKSQLEQGVKSMGKGTAATNYAAQRLASFTQTRGGIVHFYETTIP